MIKEELYFIRTSISHYYAKGSGSFATPKLYQKGQAMRWAKAWNKLPRLPSDGPWEVIPAIISYGEPIDLGMQKS